MNVIFFRTYKWEIWLSKILPYWLLFISKRERVRLRWYWRHGGNRRACKALTKALMNAKYQEPQDWDKISKGIDDSIFYWEVVK